MYTQDFYITEPVGNNAFSYAQRPHKQLFVPKLKEIESFQEIELLEKNSEKVTFEEYDFDGKMQTCFGLKNLYKLEYSPFAYKTSPLIPLLQGEGSKKIPLYLVDNHNHVFYFWYLARQQGIISDGAILYHIDEHADMRDPGEYLMKPDSQNLQKVFEYTNFFLNVGNYIIPAQQEGLIGEVVQIRGEESLKTYFGQAQDLPLPKNCRGKPCASPSIILNLDLDFFEPALDYIDFELKKQVILDIAQKADLITVCTSPYFIDQERALEVFRKIFD